ncbi:uncharacterized protein LOC131149490 [Malania oleifera]|uniref:uncharacterized protein LOC131149490 n=1 Tax=Malania oleifera TaxID=397392 RepID=UPI0025AE5D64|nr:uncharacterized protein LOC131149490 [Malania oleifera]
MCNGEFFSKEPDEALAFFDYLAKSAQQWNTRSDRAPMVVQPLRAIGGGGRYEVKEETDIQARIVALSRRVEVMELEKVKAAKSVEVPRGVIKDILVQVDKFYYPVDFVVLDMQQLISTISQEPIILGRPLFATPNALINCQSGVLKLTFENVTLEMNLYNVCKMPSGCDDSKIRAVDVIDDFDI